MKFKVLNLSTSILIVIVTFLVLDNYLGVKEKVINSDGLGYYDYLPSTFIYNDIERNSDTSKSNPFYSRVSKLGQYVDYNVFKVNKYPVGVALLQSPFFFISKSFATELDENGKLDSVQPVFQKSFYYAAFFYLLLSLVYFGSFLKLFNIKNHLVVFFQILIILSTNLLNYVSFDPGFSHVYSLFAITAFLYHTKKYFEKNSTKHFIIACGFFGLTLILRNLNLMILFFAPFLVNDFHGLKQAVKTIFRMPIRLLFGILTILLFICLQAYAWYLQTGDCLVYSYQGESFNFLEPEFFNILFSYRKGLFVYTPILLFSLIGFIWLIVKKYYYKAITWGLFFVFITYVLSSWWSWWYGGSFGLRAYIDYFPILFLPFTLFLNGIKFRFQFIFILLSAGCLYLNIIQTYQFQKYILHWEYMDEIKYWNVFNKTEPKYESIFWLEKVDSAKYEPVKTIYLGDLDLVQGEVKIAYDATISSIDSHENLKALDVEFNYDFEDEDDVDVYVEIRDTLGNWIFYRQMNILKFATGKFNDFQPAKANYVIVDFNKTENNPSVKILFHSKTSAISIKDIKISPLILIKKDED